MRCIVIVAGLVAINTFLQQQDGRQADRDPYRSAVLRCKESIHQFETASKATLVRESERLSRLCDLTPEQLRRLEVGAGGVAKRAFARVHEELRQLLAMEQLGDVEARAARDHMTNATELWDKIADHPFWRRMLKNTLTEEQSAVLERNQRELTAFNNTCWVYRIVQEVERKAGPMKFQRRDELIAALREWVDEAGQPTARPNPRNRLWWPTLPIEAQQVVVSVLPESSLAALRKLPGGKIE